MFYDLDELGCIDQGIVRSRIEPGRPPAHDLDLQTAFVEVHSVDVGDFEFAARRRCQGSSHIDDASVVKIKTGNGIIRTWFCTGFSSMPSALPSCVEVHDTVPFRIIDVIRKDGCAIGRPGGRGKLASQSMTVKYIVAENQRDRLPGYEFSRR